MLTNLFQRKIIMRTLLVLIGITMILLGLFLSLGILISSVKEKDNNGFYYFSLSLGLIVLGIYFVKRKKL